MLSRLSLLLSALGILLCSGARVHAQLSFGKPTGLTSAEEPAATAGSDPAHELTRLQASVETLRQQQQAVVAAQDDKLKQQVELLQKQIEVQQKLIVLLMEQMKKGGAAGPAIEKLQTETATLDARSKQAAQRDQELASAVDKLVEHQDALERYGPDLPAPLRELFHPVATRRRR